MRLRAQWMNGHLMIQLSLFTDRFRQHRPESKGLAFTIKASIDFKSIDI